MGISALVLDYYDDSEGQGLSKIAMPASVRGLVMEPLTAEQHAKLDDSAFGLVILTKHAHVLRKFPVNDPANTFLSAQYFAQNMDKLAFPARFIAAKHIKTACEAYDVPSSPRVDAYAARADGIENNTFVEGSEHRWLLEKMAQQEFMEKQADATEMNAMLAMPDEQFALVLKAGDGSITRKYAMPDAEHVKVAAEYFDKYAMDLAPEHRHQFASAVVRRAEELELPLTNHLVEKWASATWNQHVHAHLEQRKSLLPRNERARGVLDKLAASLEETTPEEAAKALTVFDQATGLTRYYDRGLTEPYASTMDKVATGWSEDVDGRILTEEDLKKVASSTKLAGYLGSSFAATFAKDPTGIFDSLPTPEKVLIKQLVDGTV
jgi:hypothetical protein